MHSSNGVADVIHTPRPHVHVGFYEFAPYSYTDQSNRPQGSILELTGRLLKRAGYEAEFRSYPSARLYHGLQDGSIHIWPGAPGKPDLVDYTLESQSLIGEIPLNLYFRSDMPAPTLPGDLKNQRLILLNGYTYWPPISQWLNDSALNIQQLRTNTHASALAMLQHRRGDYLLDYQAPIELERKRQKITELSYIELQRIPSKLVISKKAPAAEELRKALDQAYEILRAEGADLSLR
ncbi:substrate-binding periplasmic protein [Pseudomonas sp. TTU2014-080ASC]|uniref:substrate-binding periplasmic protein n=1 Tax=Pseudomonas sp. TTU2014-080ASC TaxID=1729724 RepID=UPI001F4CD138|nr:transporter substrate-binding domain-containing protein [Pseudomonas sp. TTU2014-080ASC]